MKPAHVGIVGFLLLFTKIAWVLLAVGGIWWAYQNSKQFQ